MMEEYIKYLTLRAWRASTIKHAESEIRKFFEFTGKKTDHTAEDVEKYYEHIKTKERKLKSSTIGYKMSQVFGYFKYLKREGHILKDPTEDIKLPFKKVISLQEIPSADEIGHLINHTDPETLTGKRDRAILELLYSTGMRRRELINLDIYDIDLKEGQIFIRNGKGAKDRVVPLGTRAVEWLKKYIEIVRTRYMKNPNEKAIFLTEFGWRLGYGTLDSLFAKYRARLKCKGKFSPHKLRHACAIGMIRNGADIRFVQELLGHRRLSTTQVYTYLSPEDLKKMHHKYHPREKIRKEKAL